MPCYWLPSAWPQPQSGPGIRHVAGTQANCMDKTRGQLRWPWEPHLPPESFKESHANRFDLCINLPLRMSTLQHSCPCWPRFHLGQKDLRRRAWDMPEWTLPGSRPRLPSNSGIQNVNCSVSFVRASCVQPSIRHGDASRLSCRKPSNPQPVSRDMQAAFE